MSSDYAGKKLLLINLGSRVEVLYSLALVNGLKEAYPELKIYYLLNYESHEILSGATQLENLVVYNPKELNLDNSSQTVNKNSLLAMTSWVIQQGFDFIINLTPSVKTTLLQGLNFRAKKLKLKAGQSHLLEQNLALLEEFSLRDFRADLCLPNYSIDQEYVDRICKRLIPASKKNLIGLAVAEAESLDLSNQQYVKLVDQLSQREQDLVLLGDDRLKERNLKIISNLQYDIIDFSNRLNIKQLELLVGKLDLVITANPEFIYLAEAQQVPVLFLAGDIDLDRLGPIRTPNIILKGANNKLENLDLSTVIDTMKLLL